MYSCLNSVVMMMMRHETRRDETVSYGFQWKMQTEGKRETRVSYGSKSSSSPRLLVVQLSYEMTNWRVGIQHPLGHSVAITQYESISSDLR